ncbi:hypothetical protein BH11MYX4_BH11MYX4_06230 [soil metagenome]
MVFWLISMAPPAARSTFCRTIAPCCVLAVAVALAGCPERKEKRAPPGGALHADGGERQREEACVDRWLSDRQLDAFGSPEGSVYAGGTPLFDESSGKALSRVEHVYEAHPEAKQACGAR